MTNPWLSILTTHMPTISNEYDDRDIAHTNRRNMSTLTIYFELNSTTLENGDVYLAQSASYKYI
ncbi:hypothetical protein TUM4438_04680 [Shewanella sairae]|uniref:Uncharacterized protein n=1 Tax=Shewanella sairae TaxID=190310 RepID=A0ABQ4P132_9GAMM|nr:hypothetical protein TUM4438_04680 [Shewanella sairae]